jgi:hypothetical protein
MKLVYHIQSTTDDIKWQIKFLAIEEKLFEGMADCNIRVIDYLEG